nr:uncharacterized protein LOC127323407 isoform X2 [Lolium perenne]
MAFLGLDRKKFLLETSICVHSASSYNSRLRCGRFGWPLASGPRRSVVATAMLLSWLCEEGEGLDMMDTTPEPDKEVVRSEPEPGLTRRLHP